MSTIRISALLAISYGVNLHGQTSTNADAEWRALRREATKQFDRNNVAEADALLSRALLIARATADPQIIVRTLDDLGILYYRSNCYEQAKRCFSEVIEIAKQAKNLKAA